LPSAVLTDQMAGPSSAGSVEHTERPTAITVPAIGMTLDHSFR
jgi:hypothetical protein